jgi:hypothetical protein
MAEQVSSVGERETRGAKVTLACLDFYAALAHETEVLKNPIPDLKKDWCKILTVTRKEDPSKFYTSPRDVFPNTGLDRSSQEKNSPNRIRSWVLQRQRNRSENGAQNRPRVTTSHLLLQDPHGKTVALLPISQPNSDFLRSNCSENARGAGSSPIHPAKVPYR